MSTPQHAWQLAHVAHGRCAQCGKRRQRSSWYCDRCLAVCTAAAQARFEAAAAKGRCRCGALNGGFRRCERCRDRENLARRRH